MHNYGSNCINIHSEFSTFNCAKFKVNPLPTNLHWFVGFGGMTSTEFKAKNKANQSNFKKAIQWLKKYNEFDNFRNTADSDGDEKAYNKWDKKCENSFDKYLDYCDELPKYEVKRIEKSELY